MKNLLLFVPALLLASLMSCDNHEEPSAIKLKNYNLKIKGIVNVEGGQLDGRQMNDDSLSTYYFIEVSNANGYHATGVFENLPDSFSIALLEGWEHKIRVKAVKQNPDYLMARDGNWLKGSPDNNIDTEITNQMNYNNPQTNNSAWGAARLYISPDSNAYQHYSFPRTNTFFKELDFTADSTNTINIELERKVFGIETEVHNFVGGTIMVGVGEPYFATQQKTTFPDTTGFDIVSFGLLVDDSQEAQVQVILINEEGSTILYDEVLIFNRLEKKKFVIELTDSGTNPIGSNNGFNIEIVDEPLYEGDVITID